MKICVPAALTIATLALGLTVLPVRTAQADPMADVCHSRAAKGSGHSGARPGLGKQVGNTTVRLSGSVALGVSRSSGAQGGYDAPAFAGDASSERREAKAQSKYTRIYNDCMRSR